jgi:hypothetical protein
MDNVVFWDDGLRVRRRKYISTSDILIHTVFIWAAFVPCVSLYSTLTAYLELHDFCVLLGTLRYGYNVRPGDRANGAVCLQS